MTKKKVNLGNVPENWYDIIPKKYKNTAYNPNFDKHGIHIPARIGIVGFSGSGKSNTILDLIYRFNSTFDTIILCLPTADEPLYRYLRDKFAGSNFMIYEEGQIPDITKFKKDEDGSMMIIFDDLMTYKKIQPEIEEWFIRGRKVAGGTTCVYISQNYFSIPKVVRNQLTHLILKKISGIKDLNLILREASHGISKENLLRMYDKATENPLSFLMIDHVGGNERKYRAGYHEVLTP